MLPIEHLCVITHSAYVNIGFARTTYVGEFKQAALKT